MCDNHVAPIAWHLAGVPSRTDFFYIALARLESAMRCEGNLAGASHHVQASPPASIQLPMAA